MKIVFIAGPYIGDGTRDCIEKNIRDAERYQIALANAQVGFFCAHNHTEHFSSGKGVNAPEQFYYDLDFEFLMRAADAVLAMPTWETSKGAIKEIAWAKEKGMKIFYPKDPSDIQEIIEWAEAS